MHEKGYSIQKELEDEDERRRLHATVSALEEAREADLRRGQAFCEEAEIALRTQYQPTPWDGLLAQAASYEQQNEKALVILEVKDQLIEELEREVDQTRQICKKHEEAELRLEEQLIDLQELRKGRDVEQYRSEQRLEELRQDLALQRQARQQAEDDALQMPELRKQEAHAKKIVVELREKLGAEATEMRSSQRKSSAQQKEISRMQRLNVEAGQEIKALIAEVNATQRELQVLRSGMPGATSNTAELQHLAAEVGRLEEALRKCQEDLAKAQTQNESPHKQEHEVQQQLVLSTLNRDLSNAQLGEHESMEKFRKAEQRIKYLEEEVSDLVSRESDKPSKFLTTSTTQTTTEGALGWVEEALKNRDSAQIDLVTMLRSQVLNFAQTVHDSTVQYDVEISRSRSRSSFLAEEVSQLQDEAHIQSERGIAHERHLQELCALSDNANSDLQERFNLCEGKAQQASEEALRLAQNSVKKETEHRHQIHLLETKLQERHEQLCDACRSLDAIKSGPEQRVGELTGRVLTLTKVDYSNRRRVIEAEQALERSCSLQMEAEGALNHLKGRLASAETSEKRCRAALLDKAQTLETTSRQLRKVTDESERLRLEVDEFRGQLQRLKSGHDFGHELLESLHKGHVEQLAHERESFEEIAFELRSRLDRPIKEMETPCSNAVVQGIASIRQLVEVKITNNSQKGARNVVPPTNETLNQLGQLLASAVHRLTTAERSAMLHEWCEMLWRKRAEQSADREAQYLRDVALLQHEVLDLRKRAALGKASHEVHAQMLLEKHLHEVERQNATLLGHFESSEDDRIKIFAERNELREQCKQLQRQLLNEQHEHEEVLETKGNQLLDSAVLDEPVEWQDFITNFGEGPSTAAKRLSVQALSQQLEQSTLRADALARQNARLRAAIRSADYARPKGSNGEGVTHEKSCLDGVARDVAEINRHRRIILEKDLEISQLREELEGARARLRAEQLHAEELTNDLQLLPLRFGRISTTNGSSILDTPAGDASAPTMVVTKAREVEKEQSVPASVAARAAKSDVRERKSSSKSSLAKEAVQGSSPSKVVQNAAVQTPEANSIATLATIGIQTDAEDRTPVPANNDDKVRQSLEKMMNEQRDAMASLRSDVCQTVTESLTQGATQILAEALTKKPVDQHMQQLDMGANSSSSIQMWSSALPRPREGQEISQQTDTGMQTSTPRQATKSICATVSTASSGMLAAPTVKDAGMQTIEAAEAKSREHEQQLAKQADLLQRVQALLNTQRTLQTKYREAKMELTHIHEKSARKEKTVQELQSRLQTEEIYAQAEERSAHKAALELDKMSSLQNAQTGLSRILGMNDMEPSVGRLTDELQESQYRNEEFRGALARSESQLLLAKCELEQSQSSVSEHSSMGQRLLLEEVAGLAETECMRGLKLQDAEARMEQLEEQIRSNAAKASMRVEHLEEQVRSNALKASTQVHGSRADDAAPQANSVGQDLLLKELADLAESNAELTLKYEKAEARVEHVTEAGETATAEPAGLLGQRLLLDELADLAESKAMLNLKLENTEMQCIQMRIDHMTEAEENATTAPTGQLGQRMLLDEVADLAQSQAMTVLQLEESEMRVDKLETSIHTKQEHLNMEEAAVGHVCQMWKEEEQRALAEIKDVGAAEQSSWEEEHRTILENVAVERSAWHTDRDALLQDAEGKWCLEIAEVQGLERQVAESFHALRLEHEAATWENNVLKDQKTGMFALLQTTEYQLERAQTECHAEESEMAQQREADKEMHNHEMVRAQNREEALAWQLERLHALLVRDSAAIADADASHAAVLQKLHVELGEEEASHRGDRAEVRRLRRAASQERKQRESLRSKSTALNTEVVQLRERLKGTDSQLKLYRDELERKRALLLSLSVRKDANESEAEAREEREERSRRALQKVQRELIRRDAMNVDLRKEAAEARILQSKQEKAEEACLSKIKALKTEIRKRDFELNEARAKVSALERRVLSEEQSVAEQVTTVQGTRTVQEQQRTTRQAQKLKHGQVSPGSPPNTGIQHKPEASVTQVGAQNVKPVKDSSAHPGESSARYLDEEAVSTALSDPAIAESVRILNLRREDLPDFLHS